MNNSIVQTRSTLSDMRLVESAQWAESTDFLLVPEREGLQSLLLRCSPRLASFRALIRIHSRYEVVILSDIRIVQLYGLYRKLFGMSVPRLVAMEIMLDEPRKDMFWRVKSWVRRVAFSKVDIVCVSSSQEIAVYAAHLGRLQDSIRFVPFHTNVRNPEFVGPHGGYVFSAGRSGRDYATFTAAMESIGERGVIVADRQSVAGIDIPPLVELLNDIPYQQYQYLLRKSELVVVPLRPSIRSSGQVVILEAMALGKPVIATRTVGTVDYIEDGITGLLVEAGNQYAMAEAILRLKQNKALAHRLAMNAFELISQRYTLDSYIQNMLSIVATLRGESDKEPGRRSA